MPIAERELRVAARSKATKRLRMLFAIVAVAIAGVIVGVGSVSLLGGGLFTAQLGLMVFNALKWIAYVFACGAGIFLTADCLSEEKREGTLGLLFLTDLHGYDVVFGKLLATSLRCFYSLLAIFPVMALSFVMGGVAAVDFRHTLIALCNALFFSLALGMVISVVSRDTNKAMTITVAGMIGFLFLLPTLDSWLGRNPNHPALGLLSPTHAILYTNSYHAADFWASVLAVHLTAWCFLLIASWLAPRTWHEKRVSGAIGSRWQIPFLVSRQGGLADQDPICWIISRDRWASTLARLVLIFAVGMLALSIVSFSKSPPSASLPPAALVFNTNSTSTTTNAGGSTTTVYSYGVSVNGSSVISTSIAFHFASWCAGLLSLVFEFWLVSHVSRFYVDGKRNGFLELLLVTPVKPAEVVRGHWLALRRLFLAPMAAQVLLSLAVGFIPILAMLSTPVAVPAGGAKLGWWTPYRVAAMQQTLPLVLGTVSWVIGLFALAWYSIWMGLASRKVNIAMLKTFCYVKILPGAGVGFAVGIATFSLMAASLFAASGTLLLWIFPVLPPLLMIVVNYYLIKLARSQVPGAFSKWIVA